MDRFAVRLHRVALGWAWLAALALLALALPADAATGSGSRSRLQDSLPPVAFVAWLIGCRGDTAPT
jgi:hypothetical protein